MARLLSLAVLAFSNNGATHTGAEGVTEDVIAESPRSSTYGTQQLPEGNLIHKRSFLNNSAVRLIVERMQRKCHGSSKDVKPSQCQGFSPLSILDDFIPDINSLVQSFSVRPVALYDGWMRVYCPNEQKCTHSNLSAHLDFCYDEFSIILQYHDGAFLFVYPKGYDIAEAKRIEKEAPTELPLVHMNAGDIAIFEGRTQPHGVRALNLGEHRASSTLFYEVPDATFAKMQCRTTRRRTTGRLRC